MFPGHSSRLPLVGIIFKNSDYLRHTGLDKRRIGSGAAGIMLLSVAPVFSYDSRQPSQTLFLVCTDHTLLAEKIDWISFLVP